MFNVISSRKDQLFKILIRFLPPQLIAFLLSLISSKKLFNLTILNYELLLKSGPRDDYFLDLSKGVLRNVEVDTLKIWGEFASKAELVVDVGAYSGLFSMFAVKSGAKEYWR